jgi:hypothetical protein
MYDRIAHLEIHINAMEGHGNLIASTANGSLAFDRRLSVAQIRRIKEALDAICNLERNPATDSHWLDVSPGEP